MSQENAALVETMMEHFLITGDGEPAWETLHKEVDHGRADAGRYEGHAGFAAGSGSRRALGQSSALRSNSTSSLMTGLSWSSARRQSVAGAAWCSTGKKP